MSCSSSSLLPCRCAAVIGCNNRLRREGAKPVVRVAYRVLSDARLERHPDGLMCWGLADLPDAQLRREILSEREAVARIVDEPVDLLVEAFEPCMAFSGDPDERRRNL